MTDADERLKALFAEDEPPARDPAFSAAALEALARRRFEQDAALVTGAAVLVGLVLWLAWPTLQPAVNALARPFMPVLACVALAWIAVAAFDRRLGRTVGLES